MKAVCSLNIDYYGDFDMIQFTLIGSITYKTHVRIRAENNFTLEPNGHIPIMSFEIVLDRLFKKIRIEDMVKKSIIRKVLERRFDELSEMMKECLEDGSIKISNKRVDKYVLVKPEMFHFRKCKIFKGSYKSDLEIDFEKQSTKKPFVLPFINITQKSYSEGALNGTLNGVSQGCCQTCCQDTLQNECQNDYQEPYQETYQEAFQESFHEPYQNDFQNDFQEPFQEAFHEPYQNDFQNDFQESFQEPFHDSFNYSFNEDSWE